MSEKTNASIGDAVQLTRKEGIFVDYETGFEVANDAVGKLEGKIGKRTHLAIQSGGLLIVRSEKPTPKTSAKEKK